MWSRDNPVRSRQATPQALAMAVLLLCAAAGILWIRPAPLEIGDVIRFEPNGGPAARTSPKLLVHRTGQFGCVLDLGVLRRSGGSLMVEGRLDHAPHTWQLHWAGMRTSLDSADCGEDAELILSSADVRNVLVAAGLAPAVATQRP